MRSASSALRTLSVVLLAVAASVLVSWLVVGRGTHQATGVEISSTYERVMRSRTLRAAYISYPPSSIVDTETGELSGIFIDLLREISRKLDLTLEFTEEVGWGTMIQGLDAKRYDIIGNAVWANPVRGKIATLSRPIYFSGVGVWVRSDEARFSSAENWASINQPSIKLVAMDGSTPEVIAHEQFPDAELITYPDLTGEPQIFLDIVGRKADVFFAEPAVAMDFLANNPGTIKNLAAEQPIRLFANVYVMRQHEPQLKQMIDVAAADLLSNGFVERLLQQYEPGPGAFYRVARPFSVPTSVAETSPQ